MYNWRRYSRPWVCRMTERGQYDFDVTVGTYTGDKRVGVVYGYGQKDYRGNGTRIRHAIWDGEKFVACDKLGRIK